MAFPSFVHLVWYLLVISRLHILSVPLIETQYGYLGAIAGCSTVSFMFLMTPSVAFTRSGLSAKQVWPVTSAVCVCLAYYPLYLKTKN